MLRQVSRKLFNRNAVVCAQCMKPRFSSVTSDVDDDAQHRMSEEPGVRRNKEQTLTNVSIVGRVGNTPMIDESNNSVTFKVGTSSFDGVAWHPVHVISEKRKQFALSKISTGDRVLLDGVLNQTYVDEGARAYTIKAYKVEVLSKYEDDIKAR